MLHKMKTVLAAAGLALAAWTAPALADKTLIGVSIPAATHGWTGGQLKIAQEAITLIVFGAFMVLYLHEPLHWRHLGAFICLMGAVAFVFLGK